MKNGPSITQWWRNTDLHSRLFLVFTALFLFSGMVMSLFLFNNVRMVKISNHARTVFEQNRQIYSLYAMTQEYEIAVNNYELNASELALIKLQTQNTRIGEMVNTLRPALAEEDQLSLDQFADDQEQLTEVIAQITQAVDEEDWSTVLQMDELMYTVLEQMYGQVDAISERGAAELKQVREDLARFDMLTLISTLLAFPIFLVLAGIAALVIYLQINQPMELLAQQTYKVLNGSIDLFGLEKLTSRKDEVGYMASEFISMDKAIDQRSDALKNEVAEIRAKIR